MRNVPIYSNWPVLSQEGTRKPVKREEAKGVGDIYSAIRMYLGKTTFYEAHGSSIACTAGY